MKRYSIVRIEPHLDVMAAYGVAGYQVVDTPENVTPPRFSLIVQREGIYDDPDLPEDVRAFDRLVWRFDKVQKGANGQPPPLFNKLAAMWVEFCERFAYQKNAESRLYLCEEYEEMITQVHQEFENAANHARATKRSDSQ